MLLTMRKEDKVHKSIIYTIFIVYGAIFDVDMKVQWAYNFFFDYQLVSTSFLLKCQIE